MLPKAILFDLDDTLIAFASVADAVWWDVCHKYAGGGDVITPKKLYAAIRQKNDWYWSDPQRHSIGRNDLENTRRKIVAMALQEIGLADTILAHNIADNFSRCREEAIHLLPGAIDVLTELRRRNVILALVTNGQTYTQWQKIERFRLVPYFAAILIEGELGFGKPDPAIYRRALDVLALQARDVWFVGDNLVWDVAAPQQQGIHSIWYDYKKAGLPSPSPAVPDRIINTLKEIIDG